MNDPFSSAPKSSSCRQLVPLDLGRPGHAHLIGIAGSGMRSLARILLDLGWTISGSDKTTASLDLLRARGAVIWIGHAPEHLPEATTLVVFSDAVAEDNPELRCAGERHIPTLRYFQALGLLAATRETVAVAGTHGKSTVAAMLGAILMDAGADPTLAYGAEPLSIGTSTRAASRVGQGPRMVVEACEYRANFLHFHPHDAVLLGIEPDHFDCYPTAKDLEHAFALFVRAVRRDGRLLVRHECPTSRRVADSADCCRETFGLASEAHWRATDITSHLGRYSFTVRSTARELCRVNLLTLGRHQVINALAAIAAGVRCGIAPHRAAASLSHWPGLCRRLEVVREFDPVTWVDDYAHHPTEVSAALSAIREAFPDRRVFCLYQPHQASRTARLLDETAASLQNAEYVLVTEIFRAREPAPVPGEISAADLAARTRQLGATVPPFHPASDCLEFLAARLRPGDVLATLGAGDIREIGNALICRLREDRAAG